MRGHGTRRLRHSGHHYRSSTILIKNKGNYHFFGKAKSSGITYLNQVKAVRVRLRRLFYFSAHLTLRFPVRSPPRSPKYFHHHPTTLTSPETGRCSVVHLWATKVNIGRPEAASQSLAQRTRIPSGDGTAWDSVK